MEKRPDGIDKLIVELGNLLTALQAEEECNFSAECLLSRYRKPVQRAIQDASVCRTRLSWLLCGSKRRKRALSACNYLYDVKMIGLGPEAAKSLNQN